MVGSLHCRFARFGVVCLLRFIWLFGGLLDGVVLRLNFVCSLL